MDGDRSNVEEPENKTVKIEVQKFFATSGAVYVAPPHTDKKQIFVNFDHPELLDCIDITKGVCIICLKKEHGILLSLFNGKIMRLIEMGISLDDIDSMSFEEIIALKKIPA